VSVYHAAANRPTAVTSTNCSVASPRRLNTHASAGRATNARNSTKRTVPPAVSTMWPGSPVAAPITTASSTHATPSSSAPHAIASDPNRVPVRPRSLMILASIGNAVMASVTPTNSAETHSGTPGASTFDWLPTLSTSRMPSSSGTVTPAEEIRPAERPTPRTRCDLNSCPTSNMNATRPMWLTT
jgi:hypothetical protein